MAQIDRSDKEKFIKIGTKKIRYGTVCMIGLLLIITFSSLGYLGNYLNAKAGAKNQPQENKIQVGVIITFDENNSITQTVQIDPGLSALFAFKEIANVTTQDTPGGHIASEVSAGNLTAANSDAYAWYLYINGGINFRGLDQYTVKNGDTVELQYAQKFG